MNKYVLSTFLHFKPRCNGGCATLTARVDASAVLTDAKVVFCFDVLFHG